MRNVASQSKGLGKSPWVMKGCEKTGRLTSGISTSEPLLWWWRHTGTQAKHSPYCMIGAYYHPLNWTALALPLLASSSFSVRVGSGEQVLGNCSFCIRMSIFSPYCKTHYPHMSICILPLISLSSLVYETIVHRCNYILQSVAS